MKSQSNTDSESINKSTQNPKQSSQLKSFKFTTQAFQVNVSLDEEDQRIKIHLLKLQNRNIYEVIIDDQSIPQELKMFLNNIKTVYDYIEVNKNDVDKINIGQGGQIHFIFLMSFGPNSQMKKQIIVETELKEVGSVEGSNVKEYFDKLREEIMQMNKKYDQEKKKTKNIIMNVEKANQRLIIESEALKLENIEFKHQISVLQEKTNSLEVLVANLYQKVDKDKVDQKSVKLSTNEQQKFDVVIHSEIQDLPLPDACKGQFSDMSSNNSKAQENNK